jgi:hypothetical protein
MAALDAASDKLAVKDQKQIINRPSSPAPSMPR